MRTSRKNKPHRNYFFELYVNDELHKTALKTKTPLLFILTRRTVLLLAVFLFFLGAFYFIGNYQNFLDETLSLIIKFISVNSVLLIIFGFAGLIEAVVLFIYQLKDKINISLFIHIFMLLFSVIFGSVGLIIFKSIAFLSGGLR